MSTCSQPVSFFVIASITLMSVTACSSASKEVPTSALPTPPPAGVSLTAMIKDGTTGLDLLSLDARAEALKVAASTEPSVLKKLSSKSQASSHLDAIPPASIRTRLRAYEFSRLEAVAPPALRKVLKSNDTAWLHRLGSRWLADESCAAGSIGLWIASQEEERFPMEESVAFALKLYDKSARCATADVQDRARFRAAMFHLWRKDCQSAAPHLEALSLNAGTNDYQSRALFWRYRCAEADQEAGARARAELAKRHPLSYHNILLQWPSLDSYADWLKRDDGYVMLRSERKPELNEVIQLMEAWLTLGMPRRLAAAHDSQAELIAQAEPEVRIYVAMLLGRSGNFIPKFRILSSVFREHPDQISRAALQLLYPYPELKMELRPDLSSLLVLSLIRQESAFNPNARSTAGALGLMQVMPRTGRLTSGVKPRELLDPESNMRVGSKYFSGLISRFNGDVELALAGYNAGPHRVDTWLKRYPVEDRVLFLDLIPFKETREYVAAIARNYVLYNLIYENQRAPASPTSQPLRSLASSSMQINK